MNPAICRTSNLKNCSTQEGEDEFDDLFLEEGDEEVQS